MGINWKNVGIIAIILTVVGTLFSFLTCGWLFNWVYLLEPVNVWKSMENMNFALSTLSGFIISLILVSAYAFLQNGIPGKGLRKGINYGIFAWAIGTLPGMFSTYVFMTVNPIAVVYLAVVGLIKYVIFGLIIAKMYK